MHNGIKATVGIVIFLFGCGGYQDYQYYKYTDVGITDTRVIPANLSWAEIDTNGDGVNENYLTSIKQQPCGDCYIYAATALYEIQYNIDHKTSINIDLSEQNIHNCLRIPCGLSGSPFHVLRYINEIGVLEENVVSTGSWGDCDNCKSKIGWLKQSQLTYFKHKRTIQLDCGIPYEQKKKIFVDALQKGPIAVLISRWNDYKKYGDIFTCVKTERKSAGHAVVIVGYEAYGNIFIIKNSHNDNGLLRVAFNEGDKCGFAVDATIIEGTYTEFGTGEDFCYMGEDPDNDGVANPFDNCPRHYNPNQSNLDFDFYGDACDPCPVIGGHPKDGCSQE